MNPITPQEFKECYGNAIPEIVIETLNNLIESKATCEGKLGFTIKQSEVVNALVDKGVNRSNIFDKHMLDFEPIYRKVGWIVKWNKGAYFEEDGSYWEFST